MARSVRDAVLLLNALVAEDVQDEITSNLRTRTPLDYTAFLQEDGLQGKRIGVMRQHFGRNATLDALMETQLQVLRYQEQRMLLL
jgi:amidase